MQGWEMGWDGVGGLTESRRVGVGGTRQTQLSFTTHELLFPICFTKTFRVVQTIKQIPERYLGVLPPTAATATAAAAYFDDGEF